MLITFNVNQQLISRTDQETPVANSKNYLYAQFSFTDEWQKPITAIFNNGSAYSLMLDDDNKCLVPWEIITNDGFSVSCFCGNRVTANTAYVIVKPSGYIEGKTPQPPSPTVYDQILEGIAALGNEKLDKYQGAENAGKVLGIDALGNAKPVDNSGGVKKYPALEELPSVNGETLVGNKTSEELKITAVLLVDTIDVVAMPAGIYEVGQNTRFFIGSESIFAHKGARLCIDKNAYTVRGCILGGTDFGCMAFSYTNGFSPVIKNLQNMATEVQLNTKQDALTAGTGISIVNGVISAALELTFEIVQTLPASGNTQTIYLVPNSGEALNIYDEYIWVNSDWEKIGTTDIDLSGYVTSTAFAETLTAYYTKTQIDTALEGKQPAGDYPTTTEMNTAIATAIDEEINEALADIIGEVNENE